MLISCNPLTPRSRLFRHPWKLPRHFKGFFHQSDTKTLFHAVPWACSTAFGLPPQTLVRIWHFWQPFWNNSEWCLICVVCFSKSVSQRNERHRLPSEPPRGVYLRKYDQKLLVGTFINKRNEYTTAYSIFVSLQTRNHVGHVTDYFHLLWWNGGGRD